MPPRARANEAAGPEPLRLGIALRKTFRDGHGRRELKADLLAGGLVRAGLGAQPLRALLKAGWQRHADRLQLARTFERGIELARRAAME